MTQPKQNNRHPFYRSNHPGQTKIDPGAHQGHDATVAKMKKDFDTGIQTLRDLMLACQIAQWQQKLDSIQDVNGEKKELQKQIETEKRKLSPKVLDLIQEGQSSLQNRVNALRNKLGSDAWSLRNYDEPVSQKTIKELGIVLTMGRVIAPGQTGEEITR